MYKWFGSCAAALCCGGTGVLAQSHVSQAKFTLDQWSFTPTYTVSGGVVKVDSVLAIRDPSGVTGDNIVAVWYVRPASGCTGWTAKGWENCDQWEAIKEVKSQLSIDDSEDAYWGMYTAKPAAIAANPGVDYEKGFQSLDPLGTALDADPNRDWIIEILAASGYTVADSPIDKAPPEGCKADDWLCAMAACAEKANTVGNSGDWGGEFFALALACNAYMFPPVAPTTVGPWGTWSCASAGNWEYDHSDATMCYYSRTQECTACRTITYPPGTSPATQTQCVYYYCKSSSTACSAPKNANGTCPPPTLNCSNSDPFTPGGPQPAIPVGPSPGLPFVPQDHPNTMPDCSGGTKPWP